MVSKRAFLALMLATSLTGSASAALASNGSANRPSSKGPVVVTLSPQLNGPMAALMFVGGRIFDAARAVIGVRIVKGPNHGTVYGTDAIDDSPDPLGIKGNGPIRPDIPLPAPQSHSHR